MVDPIRRFTAFYGAHPLHLLGAAAAWAVAGYTVIKLGPHGLWNSRVWWQSIGVWFLAAIVAHDLILFPLYALADRSITKGLAAVRHPPGLAVSAVNYVRIPTLASGLSLLLFFPGIIRQGQTSYLAATGQTQEPFLGRWLLLVGAVYVVSALAYAVRVALSRRAPA